MTYGGKELSRNAAGVAYALESAAKLAENVSASAGLEATFQRREQEWKQQLRLGEQEMRQTEQQLAASEVRKIIAEEDLRIHRENMKQADDLYDFYKGGGEDDEYITFIMPEAYSEIESWIQGRNGLRELERNWKMAKSVMSFRQIMDSVSGSRQDVNQG